MIPQTWNSTTLRRGRLLAATLATLLGASACRMPLEPAGNPPGEGAYVFIWLGAQKDAFVSCGPFIAGACPEENLNYGRHGILSVSKNGVGIKKAYVQFGLPILPAGATLEEAYFEMYHPGQREDGQTDDVRIPFGRTAAPWQVATITYKNEPNKQLAPSESSLRLRSMGWSGSPDIAGLVRTWYGAQHPNYGFYIYWNDVPGIEKAFYSNNDIRRRVNDLGLSPRLLLKVRLPAGQTASDITLPPLTADNDLPFDGQTVLMARLTTANDWPSDWDVRRGM